MSEDIEGLEKEIVLHNFTSKIRSEKTLAKKIKETLKME
jgi:hypothetical protein